MRSLDIAQEGDPVLAEVARPFEYPPKPRIAARGRPARQHPGGEPNAQLLEGLGLAPRDQHGRAAAVVRTPDGETITLLNPRICDQSAETDEQYEGCLEFLRGSWPGAPATRH